MKESQQTKTKGKRKKVSFAKYFIQYTFIVVGSFLVAFALELFLSPNGLVDGGISGIAIMVEKKMGIPLSVVLFVLNSLFLVFTAKSLGKKFFVRSLFANVMTMLFLSNFPIKEAVTNLDILIVVYGGILLGLGVGIVIRMGGAIDGTEMLAVWLEDKKNIPISKTVFICNLLVIIAAAFIFDVQAAMLGVIIFYVETKIIDFVEEGFEHHKSVMIISDDWEEIGQVLMNDLHLSITYLTAKGGYTNDEKVVIYCIVNKFFYGDLKDAVLEIDESAILESNTVSETNGLKKGEVKNKIFNGEL